MDPNSPNQQPNVPVPEQPTPVASLENTPSPQQPTPQSMPVMPVQPQKSSLIKKILIVVGALIVLSILLSGLTSWFAKSKSPVPGSNSSSSTVVDKTCNFSFVAPVGYGPQSSSAVQGQYCVYGYTKQDDKTTVEYTISPQNSKSTTTFSSTHVTNSTETINGQTAKVTKVDNRSLGTPTAGSKFNQYTITYSVPLGQKTTTGDDTLGLDCTLYTMTGQKVTDAQIKTFVDEAEALAQTIKAS